MVEISKIVIKGGSGWCVADEAYDDKVTVTSEGISYKYLPLIESRINPTRKWSYKTTSPIFEKHYADLVAAIPAVVNHATDQFCTDVSGIEFILTYSDKTKFKQTFFLPGDEFKDCFKIIKRMVPECEYVPAVLLTKDDYEDNGIE